MTEILKIGVLIISDRASQGIYEDKSGPAIKEWLERVIDMNFEYVSKVIPDNQNLIENNLMDYADNQACHLILTCGGTGPAPSDVTPEATLKVADRRLPGFGERMRMISLKYVPTAILSRQEGVIRGQSLIINLPGQPKSIGETLDILFEAVPYCVELIGGPFIRTKPEFVKAFRPKSAPPLS